MGWIIFSIFLVALAFALLGIKYTPEHYEQYGEPGYGRERRVRSSVVWRKHPIQLISLVFLLVMLPAFIAKVPANNVGIQYSPFNGTSETTLKEGYKFKNPLDRIYNISTAVQTVKVEGITTQTQDSQFVTTILDVKYQVDPANAYLVFKQYKDLETFSNTSVQSIVQKALELVTTKYDVISILGNKRADVYSEIEASLRTEFAKEGITFKNIIINDMDAGAAIEKAIEDQAVAEKAVETAKATLEKTKTEAQAQSVQAQAAQDAAKIAAETKIIEAKAEAEANDLLTKTLTAEVLQQMFIDKWNGKLPTYYGGSDSGLMFNIGDTSTTDSSK